MAALPPGRPTLHPGLRRKGVQLYERRLSVSLAGVGGLLLGAPAWAQSGPTPAAPAPAAPVPAAPTPAAPAPATPAPASTGGADALLAGEEEACLPPTTAQKVFIGVGNAAILVITLVLFMSLMERLFINKGWSPLLGRHLGVSTSLFLTAMGTGVLAYLIVGCWQFQFTVWAGFWLVIFALHLVYTLIAVPKS